MKKRSGLNVVNHEGQIIAQLYDTTIFIKKDNHFKLNSGGWRTKHTKNCINDLLPARLHLYQKDFEWYLYDKVDDDIFNFEDNMEFYLGDYKEVLL